MAEQTKNNVSFAYPGIRLYMEDPKVVIRRQIRRSFWIILFGIILGGLLLFWATLNIQKTAQGLSEKQAQIYSKIQGGQDINLQANWQEVSPYAEEIKNALPDQNNLLGYQGVLEQAATAAGVQISISFTTQKAPSNLPAQGEKKTQSLDHGIEVKGTVAGIYQFMENLENLPYFVQASSFNINSPQGQDKDSQASLSLKIYTK